jgi:antitoxin CptB
MQWKIMLSENEIKRIYWACRRGMLELDLVMVPFFEQRFRSLDERDQQRFIRLLESEDTELFQWFLGTTSPEDPELAGIVNDINAFSRAAKA